MHCIGFYVNVSFHACSQHTCERRPISIPTTLASMKLRDQKSIVADSAKVRGAPKAKLDSNGIPQ